LDIEESKRAAASEIPADDEAQARAQPVTEPAGTEAGTSERVHAVRKPRPSRPPRRVLDGILLIDKPVGVSSHDALLRAKGMFRAKKAGHTGTLDPLASGLLPLCFGEATKFSQDLLDADKYYDATMRLGERTDTGDAEGEIIETRAVSCDMTAVDAAIARFRGEVAQIPPMYSAIKRDGKPLYEYARAGQTIERESRMITIHALERLSDDSLLQTSGEVQLRVHCSKGTYIRTLAEDIGEVLGCGAHLTALRRTRVGTLRVEDAFTLQALQDRIDEKVEASPDESRVPALDPTDLLQPVDALLESFPATILDEEYARRFLHGQRLRLSHDAPMRWPEGQPEVDPATADIGRVRVYDPQARLLGTAMLVGGRLAPERLVGLSNA
jgi:tRNA pseudouridine55 synthase